MRYETDKEGVYYTCQYQTLYQGQETKDGYCHQKLLAYSVPCLKIL